MTPSWTMSGRTSRGRRPRNEDAFALCRGTEFAGAVVADGIGSQPGGREAGRIAVRAAASVIDALKRRAGEAQARAAVQAAHDAIQRAQRERPWHASMGATIVVALIEGDALSVAWAGDSRALLVRDEKCALLTRDHTRIRDGSLVVTRSLGAGAARPEVRRVAVRSADRVVLCTDGVSDALRGNDIVGAVTGAPADAGARALVQRAMSEGCTDNVTAVVIAIREDASRPARWPLVWRLRRALSC